MARPHSGQRSVEARKSYPQFGQHTSASLFAGWASRTSHRQITKAASRYTSNGGPRIHENSLSFTTNVDSRTCTIATMYTSGKVKGANPNIDQRSSHIK